MSSFKWSQTHACFVSELDAEHRALYRLADELHSAVTQKAPPERTASALRSLVAEMEDHLAHEERLMESLRYPSLAWHKQQHDTLRKRAKKAAPLVVRGDVEAAGEFLDFLARWLADHLAVADRMMGAYVRNRDRELSRAAS